MAVCRDASDSAQNREDGEEEAAREAAKRVRDEADAAMRRAQRARLEVCWITVIIRSRGELLRPLMCAYHSSPSALTCPTKGL